MPLDHRPRLATIADAPVITRLLVDAFEDDDMWGAWAFPDPDTRRQNRQAVFEELVVGAMRYPYVWLTSDESATSLWLPPGGIELSPSQEDRIDSLLRQSLGDRAAAVLRAFEQFEAARPTDPHYYLTLLGSDPRRAGRGIGQELLRSNLEHVDAEEAAAYLEARDDLVPWYGRFGFAVVGRFELADGPTVNAMWRSPRAA